MFVISSESITAAVYCGSRVVHIMTESISRYDDFTLTGVIVLLNVLLLFRNISLNPFLSERHIPDVLKSDMFKRVILGFGLFNNITVAYYKC